MKLRHILRYPQDIRRAKRMLGDKVCMDASFCSRPVALDLYSADLMIDCGRHFAAIAQWAAANKSPVMLRCSRMLLAAIGRKPFGGQMLQMPNVAWVDTDGVLPRQAIVLTDTYTKANTADSYRLMQGQQVVQLLIGEERLEGCPIAPYPMHPRVAVTATAESLKQCRQTAKRRGILFAGSHRKKYGRAIIGQQFGILNRLEILQTLREQFRNRVVAELSDSQHPQPIVLPGAATPAISSDQWLPALSAHQFFVCCPGIAQPMCHNLTESLSVGTIPIIEYGDRLRPSLQDGVNAICFQGRDGLRDAIGRIDQLSEAQIQRLSDGATVYYDQHFDGNRFMQSLCDHARHGSTTEVCLPFHNENLYERPLRTPHQFPIDQSGKKSAA